VFDPTIPQSQQAGGDAPSGGLGLAISAPAAEVAVLSVRGEIDALTTGALETSMGELLDRPGPRYVIDLGEVSFLASSGLAVLIRAAQRTAERGARLGLVVATRAVRRPLEVTGSDQLFDMHPDLESAIGDSV